VVSFRKPVATFAILFPSAGVANHLRTRKPTDPRADTLQVVVRLIEKAFFEAILPGFEHEVGTNEQTDQHG
jgi:hypothetical protein